MPAGPGARELTEFFATLTASSPPATAGTPKAQAQRPRHAQPA